MTKKRDRKPKPEAQAWETFLQWIERARPALDGCVPVALIALPVEKVEGDGEMSLDVHRGRILWPADFPPDERGPLLLRLSIPYVRKLGT